MSLTADDLPVVQVTTTDTTTDVNATGTLFPWDTTEYLNPDFYTFDAVAHTIDVDVAGVYRLTASIGAQNPSGVYRQNPTGRFTKNGSLLKGYSAGNYCRNANGHAEVASHMGRLVEASPGDTLAVSMLEAAEPSSMTAWPDASVWTIERLRK